MDNSIELVVNSALPEFKNSTLNTATKAIAAIGTSFRNNLYRLAAILARVENDEAYKEDGFKNTADYAEKTFGFRKTMCYSLTKIGKEYITEGLESQLPHEQGKDYTVTQLEKLLPLKSVDKAKNLAENNKIMPTMTCKQIEDVVKAELKKDEIETTAEETTTETEAEPAPRTITDVTNEIIARLGELKEFAPEYENAIGKMLVKIAEIAESKIAH